MHMGVLFTRHTSKKLHSLLEVRSDETVGGVGATRCTWDFVLQEPRNEIHGSVAHG
jgi:hypothetical protein